MDVDGAQSAVITILQDEERRADFTLLGIVLVIFIMTWCFPRCMMDPMLRRAVETFDRAIIGTDLTVNYLHFIPMSIHPGRGRNRVWGLRCILSVNNLTILNPDVRTASGKPAYVSEFMLKAEQIEFQLDLMSLLRSFGRTLAIRKIFFESVEAIVEYESGPPADKADKGGRYGCTFNCTSGGLLAGSNVQYILDFLGVDTEREDTSDTHNRHCLSARIRKFCRILGEVIFMIISLGALVMSFAAPACALWEHREDHWLVMVIILIASLLFLPYAVAFCSICSVVGFRRLVMEYRSSKHRDLDIVVEQVKVEDPFVQFTKNGSTNMALHIGDIYYANFSDEVGVAFADDIAAWLVRTLMKNIFGAIAGHEAAQRSF